MNRVVVIGAGIGGLTTAALLAKAGLDVTVLEAHVYPGGCAGTFYHQGYRFDAGATLAAGFEPGGGMTRLAETLGITWPVEPAEIALAAHLPDGSTVTRWTDPARWRAERERAFGPAGEPFWRWQEGRPRRCGMWRCAARPGHLRRWARWGGWPARGCTWRAGRRCGCLGWQRMRYGLSAPICMGKRKTCADMWTVNC